MKTVVGIFLSRQDAEKAFEKLHTAGITHEQLNLLTPHASAQELDAVPTEDAEQPGMGKAVGGVVGGAVGLSGGSLGAAAVSIFIAGVGPIVALGSIALGGLVGAAAGAAVGGALEKSLTIGPPQDELLFVYEDALRQGRSVVIVRANTDEEAEVSRDVLTQSGAESLDAAREQWWVGLREAEEEAYEAPHGTFEDVEVIYRKGFEAALAPQTRGQSYEETRAYLQDSYPDVYLEEAFRHGYDRGQAYYQGMLERYKKEEEAARAH